MFLVSKLTYRTGSTTLSSRNRLLLATILLFSMTAWNNFAFAVEDSPTVVFLVRHAEKQLEGDDPDLTEAGIARAQQLAEVLSNVKINQIHTTEFNRTIKTAAPLVKQSGLVLGIYDPRQLEALSEQIRETGGTHVVFGHSTTTPQLVELLGGEPSEPIAEEEYNRLYILAIFNDQVSTVLLRYGE